ncbi:MAG: hypothetical protein AB1371_07805, partial [Pseudomonadota bacterium]
MKRLSQYFVRGLLAVLPMGVTLYLLYALVVWSERLALTLLRPVIGDVYVPALGLLLAAAVVLLAGFLVSTPTTARLLSWVELPLTNLPLVKSIDSSLIAWLATDPTAAGPMA